MTQPTRKGLAALVVGLLAGLLALPLLTATPAGAQARDVSNACQGAPQSSFSDRGNAAQAAAIDCIAGYGITTGQTATSFGTGNPVQRDQMATFLARKILLVPNNGLPAAPAQNQFPCDVKQTNANGQPNPHYPNIQRLAATRNPRIAQGGPGTLPDDCYGPTQAVTRGQMATFIVRQLQFLKVTLPTNAPNAFTDDNGNDHEPNINIVAQLGIAQGTGGSKFEPNAPTTRGQMAFFLSRDLSVLVANNKLTNPFSRRPVTALPELIRAEVVSTTTSAQQTPTNPAGTRVRFVFDETLATSGQNAPAGGQFFVHNEDNTRFAGQSIPTVTPTVEADNKSVIVNFSGVATSEAAATLTLATVNDGAVRDSEGNTNAEGDAPIGSSATQPVGQAGITSAPDLVSVGPFRQAAQMGQTAVDFKFDQPAFRTTGTTPAPGDFVLVRDDGTEVVCTPPASGSTGAGGGTSAGGEGTTTITVVCNNPGATNIGGPLATPGTPLSESNVARGTVAQGAVAATAAQAAGPTADQNPLQAADTTDPQSTTPDLLTAVFALGTGTDRDAVTYTFDQPVNTLGAAGLFGVYLANGTEVFATAPGGADNPAINPTNPAVVRATFPQGTLTNAVGANVRDGAVTATSGGANQQDEVAASAGATTTRTAGQTTGPNLTAVALTRPNDQFGNPGNFQATYTFDEPVTLQTAAQSGAATQSAGQTLFHLFTSTGTRLTSTACTVGTGTTNTQVTCTAYNVAGGSTAATSTQIGSAVLGTVDFAAVFGGGGGQTNATDRNPEGSRPTTGGTGTPSTT